MSYETHEATLTRTSCDYPGCKARNDSFMSQQPWAWSESSEKDWVHVPTNDQAEGVANNPSDFFFLCPTHADQAPTIRLILKLMRDA